MATDECLDSVLKDVENLNLSSDNQQSSCLKSQSAPGEHGDSVLPKPKKKVSFQKKKSPEDKTKQKEKLLQDWIEGNRTNAICFLNQMTPTLTFADIIDTSEATPTSNESRDNGSTVRLEYEGKLFQGQGNSKKLAKQAAASAVLHYIETAATAGPSSCETSSDAANDTRRSVYTLDASGRLTSFSEGGSFIQKSITAPKTRPQKNRFSSNFAPRILARPNGTPLGTQPLPAGMQYHPAAKPIPVTEQTQEMFKNPAAILNCLAPNARYNIRLVEEVKQISDGAGKQTNEGASKQTSEGTGKQTNEETGALSNEGANKQTSKGAEQQITEGAGGQTNGVTGKQTSEGADKQTTDVMNAEIEADKPIRGKRNKNKNKNSVTPSTDSANAPSPAINSTVEPGPEPAPSEDSKRGGRGSVGGRFTVELLVHDERFEVTTEGKKRARSAAAALALLKIYEIQCEPDEDGLMRYNGSQKDWIHLKPTSGLKSAPLKAPRMPNKTPTSGGAHKAPKVPPPATPEQHPVCILCEICPSAKFTYSVIREEAASAVSAAQKPSSAAESEASVEGTSSASLFTGAAEAAQADAAKQPPIILHICLVELEGLKFEGKGSSKAAAKKEAAEKALVGIQSITSIADRLRVREQKKQMAVVRKRGGTAVSTGRRSVMLSTQDYEYGYRRMMGGGGYDTQASGGYGRSRRGGGQGGHTRPDWQDGMMSGTGYGRGRGMNIYQETSMDGSREYMAYMASFGGRLGGGYGADDIGSEGIMRRGSSRGRNYQRPAGEPYPVGLMGSGPNSPRDYSAGMEVPTGRSHSNTSISNYTSGYESMGSAGMGSRLTAGMVQTHGDGVYFPLNQQAPIISGWRGGTFNPYQQLY